MPDYDFANLAADQPCLWLPLALPAYQLAGGTTSTFEVSQFNDDSTDAQVETLSVVHSDKPSEIVEQLRGMPRAEWGQIAAGLVIASFLRLKTNQRIQRISRFAGGLCFYLEPRSGEEDCLLYASSAEDGDVQKALEQATEQVQYAPCACRIAAAVAFASGKAAVRVMS